MNALLSSPVLSLISSWLLSYLFNALWQTPLVFAAAWIATRMLRRAHPRLGHRVWVGALFLQVVLPACDLHVASLWHALLNLLPSTGTVSNGGVHILMGSAATAGGGTLRLPLALETGLVLAWVCCILYFAGRLVWGLLQTRRLARNATRIPLTGEAAQRWTWHCHRLGITAPPPEIAASPHAVGPVTVGLRRGLVLLPPTFLEDIALPGAMDDLDAVFAHELAHIARRDFAKNLLYGLVSLPIAWHPVTRRTRAGVAETRELICDAIAAETVVGRKQYAQSLLRLASMRSGCAPVAALHAIGILSFRPDSRNPDSRTFERRIMTLTHKPAQMSIAQRIAIAAACSVLALATCTSALALHTDISELTPDAQQSAPQSIHVSAKEMSGNRISGNNPTYPPEERKKKVQGTVVLDTTISKEGAIENLRVVKSPAESLSQSALDAVRTWRYRPYLLNGEPIAVETTVNVTFCIEPCKLPPGEWHRVP